MNAEREKQVAYHEAGHAIIDIRGGMRKVELIILWDDESKGTCVSLIPTGDVIRKDRQAAYSAWKAISAVAGSVAECMYKAEQTSGRVKEVEEGPLIAYFNRRPELGTETATAVFTGENGSCEIELNGTYSDSDYTEFFFAVQEVARAMGVDVQQQSPRGSVRHCPTECMDYVEKCVRTCIKTLLDRDVWDGLKQLAEELLAAPQVKVRYLRQPTAHHLLPVALDWIDASLQNPVLRKM